MTTSITVEGMTCGHCEQTVEAALQNVPGVTEVSVDREGERASVDGDADPTAPVAAVEDAGYSPVRADAGVGMVGEGVRHPVAPRLVFEGEDEVALPCVRPATT